MIKIKVAIISDIHGNIVALKEILKDVEQNKVDDIVFLGDLVNDLPFGNETLDLVRKTSSKVIKGNKEQYLIEFENDQYDWENIQFRNTRFMYNELREDNLEYIRGLNHFLKQEYEGVKILFAHGSPNSVEELIHQRNQELKNKYTKDLEEDALIIGHTHEKMWVEQINGKLMINAGCSGVSPHYVAKSEYVILEIDNGKITNVDLRLVDFDLEILKNKIIESGILDFDKVLMNLTFGAISGKGIIRENFFKEGKQLMESRNKNLYKDNAKGIFKYFKLFDDDIWLGLADKYNEYFCFK